MKSFIYAVVAATALSASYGAFAQSNPSGQLTRAQVRAELVQLEQAGYKPEVSDQYYPRALQTAQARVTNADETGYGAQAAAGVRAGRAIAVKQDGRDSVYFGQVSKPDPRADSDPRVSGRHPAPVHRGGVFAFRSSATGRPQPALRNRTAASDRRARADRAMPSTQAAGVCA